MRSHDNYGLWRWSITCRTLTRCWKVNSEWKLQKRISTGKDGVIQILPPVSAVEIHAVEKERNAKNILLNGLFEQGIQGASKHITCSNSCTPSTSSTNIPEKEVLAGFANKVIYFLFAKQLEDWDLLHEDLEQIDDLDIEEMDINWQIAMIAIRMNKFYKKTGRRVRVDEKTPVGFDKKKLECFNCHNTGSIGTSSEHSVDPESEILSVPPEVYVSTPTTTNEKGVSDPKSKEVEPSCVAHIKTHRQPIKDQATPKVNRKNWNVMMERELGEVWTNANRVNHANQFVPRSVQLNAGRPNINSVRPNINTGRTNVNPVRPRVNTGSSNVNTVRSRQPGNWGSAVKTSAGYNWRNSNPNSNCDSGPTFIRTDHPLKNMVDRGIFDSGCSGHMTGNKDQLEDFEEFNGGSVTFGGSKGYISGKGKIRVGNLDFDSVSFVKELGHFNLFSISQICDKQHKVLFTETECLVVSSDFKMPDENQILLKVPRHHPTYRYEMKNTNSIKGFC
ncbi:hypothetical protein Tco_0492129 [Tanacetum coccineum]